MGTQGGTEGSRAMREGAEDQDGRGRDDLEALHTPVQAFHVDPGASLHHDLVHSTSARLFSGLFQSVRFCPEQPGCEASGQGHTPTAAAERQGPDPEPSPCPADPPLGHHHHQRDPLHLLEGGEGILAGSIRHGGEAPPPGLRLHGVWARGSRRWAEVAEKEGDPVPLLLAVTPGKQPQL